MEAEKLKIKKQIKKGKLKKTMKNIICKPDPTFWPLITVAEGEILLKALNELKVEIPVFKKPHWSEISQIPKELRPKPPPIRRVEGLLFGIMECRKAIENKECIGVLIEATLNPKAIVQPLIDVCYDKSIPVLCVAELKSTTKINFDIATSVLGVKKNCLLNLEQNIHEIAKCHILPVIQVPNPMMIDEDLSFPTNVIQPKSPEANEDEDYEREPISCPYLYRAQKNMRVFVPTIAEKHDFEEHNIIRVSDVAQGHSGDSKKYLKMNVKKISSNPNRNGT